MNTHKLDDTLSLIRLRGSKVGDGTQIQNHSSVACNYIFKVIPLYN